MNQNVFLKGWITGARLRGHSAGPTAAGAGGGSGEYDKASFLAGLAAGMASRGAPLWGFEAEGGYAGRDIYAQYFTLRPCISAYSDHLVDEYGMMIVVGETDIVERAALYVAYNSFEGCWQRTGAVRGDITTATLVPYVAYQGEIVASGLTSGSINTFPLTRDSHGVYSVDGSYTLIDATLEDANGNLLTSLNQGISQSRADLFTDLNAMKAYMNA